MGRVFNGTTDRVDCGKGDTWAFRGQLYALRTDRRYSHPRPFQMDNGDFLLGHCTNELTTAYQYRTVRSSDGGYTFPSSSSQLVASSANDIFEGSFTQAPGTNGVITCIYGDGTQVIAKKSVDRAATWDPGTVIIDSGTINDPHPDHLRLSNGDLFCVWSDSGDIKYSRSTDGGTTWSAQAVVVDTANTLLDPSIIELSPNNLLCAYREQIGASSLYNCMTTRSTNNGVTWSTPVLARGATLGALPSPNLVKLDTGETLMFFTLGVNRTLNLDIINNHLRSGHLLVSQDDGVTWLYETCVYSGRMPNGANYPHGDIHRIMPLRDNKGQCAIADLWVASAYLDGCTEYRIARFDPP